MKALLAKRVNGSSSVASSSTGSTANSSTSTIDTNTSTINENDVGAGIEVGDNRESMLKLIKLAIGDGDEDHYRNLRTHEDPKLFEVFVDFCLIHLLSCLNWRWQSYSDTVSNMFTSSDEALAMLLLENNAADLLLCFNSGAKVSRKQSKPKYTKISQSTNIKFQGWSRKGIKRFNELLKTVTANRKLDVCKEREHTVRLKYLRVSGRDMNINVQDNYENEEDSDDDDESDIEAHDEFMGEITTEVQL
ncbi:MAG: hypothetical protein GY874_18140 [Desulfobacteraceae bacterium]|nr:hypothetical protein [Desulfobacteraceae bacterium]